MGSGPSPRGTKTFAVRLQWGNTGLGALTRGLPCGQEASPSARALIPAFVPRLQESRLFAGGDPSPMRDDSVRATQAGHASTTGRGRSTGSPIIEFGPRGARVAAAGRFLPRAQLIPPCRPLKGGRRACSSLVPRKLVPRQPCGGWHPHPRVCPASLESRGNPNEFLGDRSRDSASDCLTRLRAGTVARAGTDRVRPAKPSVGRRPH